MSIGPDSGDSEILQHTIKTETGVKLVLSDGHELQGGPIASFAEVSGWCDGVRQAIRERIERSEQEARARKGRSGLEQAERDRPVPVPENPRGVQEDPRIYAEAQEEYWLNQLHTLKEQAEELSRKLDQANKAYTGWVKIVEALDASGDSEPGDTAGGDNDSAGGDPS